MASIVPADQKPQSYLHYANRLPTDEGSPHTKYDVYYVK